MGVSPLGYRLAIGMALALAVSGSLPANAQQAPAPPSLERFIAQGNLTVKSGLFPLYQDPQTGAIYMAIRADQIGKEFLYTAHIENGIADVVGQSSSESLGRGRVLEDRIFKIVRPAGQARQLEFIDSDTNYYYDPASPLALAQAANVAPEVFAVADIKAAASDQSVFLIAADDVFGREAASRLPRDSTGAYTGKLRVVAIHEFPDNTEFVTDYLYGLGIPQAAGRATNTVNLGVRVHHSLIALGDSDYAPRADDYRVGYLTIQRTDLTSTAPAPYVDVIQRWNLKKKDPSAALSEPVKPITFWIENTTPMELRDAVRRGVLTWNKALEAAGFKDAIRVEDEPDDADWSPDDVRHNMIRWVSSQNLDYYGDTWKVVNPHTGEILNATIMLDYWTFRRDVRDDKLFASRANGAGPANDAAVAFNSFGPRGRQGVRFGLATLGASAASPIEVSRLINEAVQSTVAHEVGHALGLSHNFRASTVRPFAELGKTDEPAFPLSGSVMDYMPINIARKGEHQGAYFMTDVGPYDIWAIQYGYTPSLADPVAEAARVKALLARSSEPQLAFGSPGDAPDAERAPDRGIDPRVMQWDLSSDPVAWATDRMQLVDETVARLKAEFVKPGQSYQDLYDAFAELMDEKARAAWILSRYVGGVYVEDLPADVPGATPPFTAVPMTVQKAALAALRERIFAPSALRLPADLIRDLQEQRRGSTITEDPDVQGLALEIQDIVLDQMLSPRVLARMTNARSYGNSYSVAAFLADLTDAIFAADNNSNVNAVRQALQTAYIVKLAQIVAEPAIARQYDAVAQAAALRQLKAVRDTESTQLLLRWVFNFNAETIAHREHLDLIIDKALSTG